jgi:hypothetical protein
MSQRLRYSQHALQRLDERGILRCWVDAVVGTTPQVYGRDQIFTLSAGELARRCGGEFRDGLRVVVDSFRRRVVTVYWLDRGAV